ncbi:SGNH/GDSL hydrolase family protein [Fimbriiglobus ruber]|nr:SGNH/GDSL hydrolase family protein [Fimbriiglobus ruber]
MTRLVPFRLACFIAAFTSATVPARGADPAWVVPMKKVHAKFTGTPGTFALFGDSITTSLAFWAPWPYAPKTLDAETAKSLEVVRGHMKEDCWRKWRGPEFGSEGGKTIAWADENVDRWLKALNPEAVVLMFGTNDLTQVDAKNYETKLRAVIGRCLKNGRRGATHDHPAAEWVG